LSTDFTGHSTFEEDVPMALPVFVGDVQADHVLLQIVGDVSVRAERFVDDDEVPMTGAQITLEAEQRNVADDALASVGILVRPCDA
jgi:hypothetical protein